jgi:hypothetical protein
MTGPCRRSRSVVLATAAFFLCCGVLPDPADAKPLKAEYQDLKIRYTADKAGTMATSIDLVILGTGNKALNKFQVQVSAKGFTVGYGSGAWTLTGNVNDGATVTIDVKSINAYNGSISVQSAIFVNATKPTGQGAVTGGKLSGDPIYEISNDLAISPDLTVEDLLFYDNHPAVDFSTLDPSVPIDATGIPEANVTLDGDGALADYALPTGADTPYFIAQGEVFLAGGSTPAAWFVDGYTTVPEPPVALLLSAPLLTLMWAARRRAGVETRAAA